jgi:hypothetical protein
MKIRCAFCKKLFTPSRGQIQTSSYGSRHYCARACKNADQVRKPKEPELVNQAEVSAATSREPHEFHVYLRCPDIFAFRRFLAGLTDDRIELVKVRHVKPSGGHKFALTLIPRAPRPGSITDLIRQACERAVDRDKTGAT